MGATPCPLPLHSVPSQGVSKEASYHRAVQFYTCRVHYCTQKVKPPKDKPQSDSRQMGGEKAISKRLLSNATYEQLLDDDLRVQAKRDKKNSERDDKQDNLNEPAKKSSIRLTLSMLSPNLKRRFAALQLS